MRALVIGDGGRLSVVDRPVPEPRADQVLVRVHGAGVNRADLLQRAGRYPAPAGVPADIPGLEFAGRVEAVGPDVTTLAPGTAVMGIVGGGAQAEYLTTAESHCVVVPGGLDLVTAGGIPEAFCTAHDAMVVQGGLEAGEHVLIHAVGSGVGTAALQLARCRCATVTGTSRNRDKLERAVKLGLDHAVPVDAGVDPSSLAAVATVGGPAHVVVDLVGGPYLGLDVAAAAPGGRILIIGLVAGASAPLDMGAVLGKRLRITGTTLRSRSAAEKSEVTARFAADVVPLLTSGELRPVVDCVVPLEKADEAYEIVGTDRNFGRTLLDLRS